MPRAIVGPSRLERIWEEQYRGSSSNRVRDYVRLSALEADDIDWFADRDDLELTPEHYGERGIRRFIAISPELMKLLGFYLAEGSCSDRNGVRLSIGKSNVRFSEEMADGFMQVFGLAPQSYPIDRGAGELKLVNRVAALAWQHLLDRKSTRLNSSHSQISYAVFCLKKKKQR